MPINIAGYKINEIIHTGTRTIVCRGRMEKDGAPVVVKTLKSAYPTHKETSRLRHEYAVLQDLQVRGVAKPYSLERHENGLALIMEDFQGVSLRNFLKRNTASIREFLNIASSLSEIVGAIHRKGIVHKDIKPGNIVINPETKEAWIIDFGLSTRLQREEQGDINPGSLEGTLAYMSPEQTGRMNRSIDYRTDFYSLGVTFYEMLTGEAPFRSADPMALVHCHIAKMPISPHEMKDDVPGAVSGIVMKLISKNAEDRYQSAYGLKMDLDACLRQLNETGRIDDFIPGRHDAPERIQISRKLYGRDAEIAQLMEAFQRAGDGGTVLFMVSGYSGVGKSSLVNEVHKPMVQKRGYFISGKHDQYKRNIPYSAITQAFQALIRQLLTEEEEGIQRWRGKLLDALGPNIRVIIDIIPEVELLMGKQPPVPQLGDAEAQSRFQMVFQRFIGIFAQKDHPLAIFLDDLQWMDLASIHLFKAIITNQEGGYLLLIGAYRDNEVDAGHPMMMAVEAIRKAGAKVDTITLSPLKVSHINEMIVDTLRCSGETARPLSELLERKTGGNPFFVTQFLHTLYEEGLLAFDCDRRQWQWDLDMIHNVGVTDNVVDLMSRKIRKYSGATQHALRLAACIGNQFDIRTLSAIYEKSGEETFENLWDGVRDGLVVPLGDCKNSNFEFHASNFGFRASDFGFRASDFIPSDPLGTGIREKDADSPQFKFLHDRVQQAAYSLITDDQKKGVHLAIGRILLKNGSDVEREENLFGMVNHLNTGMELITSQEERNELARMNLRAGRKAKASTAYEDALRHITIGMELLAEQSWHDQYELTLSLHNEGASAACLCGDFQKMDTLVALVLKNAKTVIDRVKAYQTKIQAFMAQNKLREALDTTVEIVNMLGVSIPRSPKARHILAEKLKTKWALRGKAIESLIDLPRMTDPVKPAALQLLSLAVTPAYFTSPALFVIIINKMVALSVVHGNTPVSSVAYVFYAMLLCITPDTIDAGYRFGRLALQLRDRFQARELTAILHGVFYNLVFPFKRHLNEVFEPFIEGHLVGVETGSLEFACICASGYCGHLVSASKELVSSGQAAVRYCERVRPLHQTKYIILLEMFLQIIVNMQGKSADPCRIVGDVFNEDEAVPIFHQHNDHHSLANLYVNKLFLSYTFGNYHQALEDALATKKHYFALGHYHVVIYNFYHSLTLLALYPESPVGERRRSLKTVVSNQKTLKKWAHHAPMNNLHKYYLVAAELARVKGKEAQAAGLYDKAIALAHENDYVNEEALANEAAGRFYLSKGKEKVAGAYLQDSRHCYYRWGAHGKVKDLEERYPRVFMETSVEGNSSDSTSPGTTSGDTTSKALDLSTVIKVSGAIAGEIVLEKLLVKLMKIVIENAGAQKGFLIMEKEGVLVIGAEGQAGSDEVKTSQDAPVEKSGLLPVSVVNYTQRTRETVVLNDAAREGLFTDDPYIRETQPKSLLCACMVYRGRMIGILYLENNLACGAFTPERVEFLKILSSQMAISVENAQLYGYLEQKVEARTQELAHTLDEMVVLNDALRQAKKVADEASRAKSEFIANISHEVRTPLNAVIGLAELALKTQDTAAQREYMEMIKASGETLLNLANDVLDLSKIESGKWELDTVDFGLRETVQKGVGALAFQARSKGLDFQVSIAEDVPDRLCGDPQSLRQVLTNLVGNAVKFTEKGNVALEVSTPVERSAASFLPVERSATSFVPVERSGTSLVPVERSGTSLYNAVKFTEKGNIVLEVSMPVERSAASFVPGERSGTSLYNAVKFTEKGNVALEVSMPVERSAASFLPGERSGTSLYKREPVILHFSVRDTGIGIPEDKHGRIFESFTQADGSVTRRYGGTGLGAAISKKLVELMGGDIWFESKPGVGSTFHFRVTFARSERESERDICPITDTIRPLNILLAEDKAFNQRVIADTLKMNGHQVTVAGNGKEAIEQWEKGAYNLVLMDIQMPEMSGFEATEAIRRREAERGGHTVIIAISANAMKEDREKCLHAGMDAYIPKPIDMKKLFSSLRKYSGISGRHGKPAAPGRTMAGEGTTDFTVRQSNNQRLSTDCTDYTDRAAPCSRPMAGDEPPCDTSDLFNLDSMPALKNNPEMLERYVRSFMKDMNDEMGNMERAIREGDHDGCRKAAHAVKGMSGHLKSGQITLIAGEIEHRAAENNLKGAAEGFLELKKHFAEVGKMLGI